MDLDRIEEEEEEERARPRTGCLGRLFLFLFFLVILAVAAGGGLSSFLNTEKGKKWAQKRTNALLGQGREITFTDWSVSWFSPLEIRNLTYFSPREGIAAKAESVSSSLGLFRLFPVGVLNLGTVTVKNSLLTFTPPLKQPTVLNEGEGEEDAGFFFLPVADVAAALVVENGQLRVFRSRDDKTPFRAREISARITLPAFRKPIPVSLELWTGKNGRLTVHGEVRSLAEMWNGSRSDKLRHLSLEVSSLDVSQLAGVLYPDLDVAEGVADGSLNVGQRDTRSFTVSGDVKVARFSLYGEKKARSPANDLAISVHADIDAAQVRVEKLHVSSPWLDMEGKGIFAPRKADEQGVGSLQVKAKVNLTRFTHDFRKVLRGIPPMVGTASLNFSGRQYAEQRNDSFVMNLNDFAVEWGNGKRSVVPKGTVKVDAVFPFETESGKDEVSDVSWSISLGDDTCTGSLSRWDRMMNVSHLHGLTVKLDAEVSRILPLFRGILPPDVLHAIGGISGRLLVSASSGPEKKTTQMRLQTGGNLLWGRKANGVADVPFSAGECVLSFPYGRMEDFLTKGTASASLRVGAVNAYGFYLGPAPVKAQYSSGLLRLEYATALNGGRLTLTPDIYFQGKKTVIRSPRKTQVLENVTVTQEMVESWLARINPLFEGCRVKSGTISADLNRFSLDTSLPPEKGLNAEIDLSFKNVRLILGPAFDEMLDALNINSRLYQADELPIRVTIRNGLVYMGKTTFTLDGQPVTIVGWSAFDGRIRYDVEVGLTERLFAKWGVPGVGKLLQGKTVMIQITGTAEKPHIDLGGIAKSLNGLMHRGSGVMKQGAELMDKGADLLQQLKKELRK